MKVSIITNTNEVCGNAEYARDLSRELSKYFPVEIVNWFGQETGNVVIVNWHEAVVPATGLQVSSCRQQGKKVIVILQNSWDAADTCPAQRDWSAPEAANVVVAHEKMTSPWFKVKMIPHAIHVVPGLASTHDDGVGTAGFLFSWKRPDLIPAVADRLRLSVRIVHPKYMSGQIVLADPERFQILYHNPLTKWEIVKDYLPLPTVVRILSKNLMNIFWFESQGVWDQLGQTGSARMGVSAQRPMIISRHRKFRSFEPYADEFYVADTEEDVYRLAKEIVDTPEELRKVPRRCLEEMSWEAVGRKYKELIEETA